MFSEYLPCAKLCGGRYINFSDDLSFELGIFIPHLLMNELKLIEVKKEAFGSMTKQKRCLCK